MSVSKENQVKIKEIHELNINNSDNNISCNQKSKSKYFPNSKVSQQLTS